MRPENSKRRFSRNQLHIIKGQGWYLSLRISTDSDVEYPDRLTALELQTLKIPSVMLCDSMVGSLFQHHNIAAVGELWNRRTRRKRTDTYSVAVGADRIARNGDTANKDRKSVV